MKTKKTELNLSIDLPLYLDLISGNLSVVYDNNCFAEIYFPDNGFMEPEIKVSAGAEKNILLFSSLLEGNADIILHLPENLLAFFITSNSGNLVIAGAKSEINAVLFDGDLKIVNSSGKIVAESFKGFVSIDGYRGVLSVKNSNGPVRITNWTDASGVVENISGGITAGLTSVSGKIKMLSRKSRITLGITRNFDFEINAKGAEVINYLDGPKGKNMGITADIKPKKTLSSVELVSEIGTVAITDNKYIEKVSPDIENMFGELDAEFEKSLKSLVKGSRNLGKKIGFFGKKLAGNLSKKTDGGNEAAKLEIVKMLKEGKITAEEAEKLLKLL